MGPNLSTSYQYIDSLYIDMTYMASASLWGRVSPKQNERPPEAIFQLSFLQNWFFWGFFDPVYICFDNKNKYFSG